MTRAIKALNPNSTEEVRIIQITDPHIFAEADGCLLGLNTRDSLEAVLERVAQEELAPDLILATGDLSQDASFESYRYLAERFDKMGLPCFWLPGNHDLTASMDQALQSKNVHPEKHIIIGEWQIVLLNSSVPGKVFGELSDSELAFLDGTLQKHPDHHALVVLHHQPVEIGSKWLDNIGLRNSEAMLSILSRHSQARSVLWGHIHQEFDQSVAGLRLLATPSTCVQFKPLSEDFSADTESPGYRYLTLKSDGTIDTLVHRVRHIEFKVDYTVKGY